MEKIFSKIKDFITIKGVIQVGANVGQECDVFKSNTKNIICFEPIPNVYEVLKTNNSDIITHQIALGDKNEVCKMYVASNNGESSSILKPLNHLKHYSTIKFDNEINIEVKRFDSLDVDMSNYNILVSDTQGYEIKVLAGFGANLNHIDSVVIEYINSDLYENDSTLSDITKFLTPFGFVLIETFDENIGSGVALYIKN
jgi:FkbM family methyltransferase